MVAKINPDGQFEWARTAGTEGYDSFAAISLLDNGHVLVGGGSGTVQGFVGPRTVAMVRQFDDAGQPVDTADPALPLLVTQIAGLEGVEYVAAGERNSDRDYRQGDAVLFRADASGKVAWRADYTNALVARLAVVEGVVYVVGQTGIIEFDGEPVAGAQDVFADGYQLDGARLWRHSISSSERDIPQSLVPAPGGVEVLARLGQVPGGLEFDTCPCPVAAPGAYGDIDGVFTLALDRDGNATALDPAADGTNVLGPSGEHYGVTLVLDAGTNQARRLTRIRVTRFR